MRRPTPQNRALPSGQRNRRSFLRIGALGGIGLTLPQWFAAKAQAAASAPTQIDSCILIFYYGGPSQVDTYDLKPEAPPEVRGEFKPIATSAPGVHVCDQLPHTARVMDKICVIRSMHHGMRNHNSAAVEALCGRTPLRGDLELLADDELSFPCYGAIFDRMLTRGDRELTSIALPHVMRNVVRLPGQDPGLLGAKHSPLQIEADPNHPAFKVGVLDLPVGMSIDRLEHRRSLLSSLNQAGQNNNFDSLSDYQQRAFGLIRSESIRRALDITREPEAIRDAYGRNTFGQSLLLARRLVEAQVPFVTVYDGVHNGQDVNWDSHASIYPRMRNHLLPPTDLGFARLIEDLSDRGLLKRTLVVAMGEFGRTPRINTSAGRDHWPDCYSVLLAGGGVAAGTCYGKSDRIGAYPDDDPVGTGDLAATLCWAFGIDYHQEILDPTGRPIPLTTGEPLKHLFHRTA